MLEQSIQNRIFEAFEENAQKSILDFMEFLDANGLSLERGSGYWKDKFYLLAKRQDETVFYILLNGNEDSSEPQGLTIWSGENSASLCSGVHPDQKTKEIMWKHVDICKNCGGCSNPGGTPQTIFGKAFDNVCITPMRFDHPSAGILECLKALLCDYLSHR